jgi:5-methylcytosine-specific restriction enzyme A
LNRKPRRTGPPESVIALVRQRDKYRCLICGIAGRRYEVHHRRPRGAGGTTDPTVNQAGNLVNLCTDHHRRVEANRAEAYLNGWLLRMMADPERVPFKCWDGWHLLAHNGTRKPVGPPRYVPTNNENEEAP